MSKCRKIANKGNCARLSCNISSVKDFLIFILDVSEFILSNINNFKEEELTSSNIKLEDVALCNQRIFCFVSKDKYFSVNYPIKINEKALKIHLRDCNLTLSAISKIKGILDNLFDGFNKKGITLEESNNNSLIILSKNELRFVEQVLSLESGYVRYDFDERNENGRFHPLNHLDLNYNVGTFKIGFYRRLTPYEFMTVLGCNINDECAFIEYLFHKQWRKDTFHRVIRYIRKFMYKLFLKL